MVATGAGAALTNTNLFGDHRLGLRSIQHRQHHRLDRRERHPQRRAALASSHTIEAISAPRLRRQSHQGDEQRDDRSAGAGLNPINPNFTGGGSGTPTALPAGILAGYNGVPVFGPASGPYTSCGVQACVTLRPDPDVNGTVTVINNGAIGAAGGYGVFAYNFGNGAVSVTSNAPIVVTGATSQNGIKAFSAEGGAITVTTTANVSALNGNGVFADSVGKGPRRSRCSPAWSRAGPAA